jgi:Flp pilus assembly pilin Flp
MAQRLIQLGWRFYIWKETFWCDRRGQDLIEYALMSGLIATGVIALSPQLASSISTQFSRVATPLSSAAQQGS